VIRFTEEDIKEIKYVLVEVALKKDASNKTKGLFLGCQPMVKSHTQLVSKDEEFFWLYKGGNVHMYNLTHYGIHLLEVEKGNLITTYTAGGEEQSEYIKRLKLIQQVFAKHGNVLKSGLIDADEYTVPAKVLASLAESTGGKHTPHDYSPTRSSSGNHTPSTSTYGDYYKRKEVSTFTIKRTTKYPAAGAIEQMRAKVEEIKKGAYKAPKLPALKGPVKEFNKPAAADDDDDDCGYGYLGNIA